MKTYTNIELEERAAMMVRSYRSNPTYEQALEMAKEELDEEYIEINEAEILTVEGLTKSILTIRNAKNLNFRQSIEVNEGWQIMNAVSEYIFRNDGSEEDEKYTNNICNSRSISLEGATKFATMIIDNDELKVKIYRLIK